jgi:hypothetical protein
LNNCNPGGFDVYQKALGATDTTTPHTITETSTTLVSGTATSFTMGAYPQCPDGLDLVPVTTSECPFFKNRPNCLKVGPGELCEADGECGTDPGLNNCNPGGWDIYRKAMPSGPTPAPAPTYPSCSDGIPLIPLDSSLCPADITFSFPRCTRVSEGELCEADGECGTDNRLDNCMPGFWDIYAKGSYTPLNSTDTTTSPVTATATTTTPAPPLMCADFLELIPVTSYNCPWFPGFLDNCDVVAPGTLCEGDGECGTDGRLNNCRMFDVYMKAAYPVCPNGDVLEPVATVDCPDAAGGALDSCDVVAPGEYCSASGECGTMAIENCGTLSVYYKQSVVEEGTTTTVEEGKFVPMAKGVAPKTAGFGEESAEDEQAATPPPLSREEQARLNALEQEEMEEESASTSREETAAPEEIELDGDADGAVEEEDDTVDDDEVDDDSGSAEPEAAAPDAGASTSPQQEVATVASTSPTSAAAGAAEATSSETMEEPVRLSLTVSGVSYASLATDATLRTAFEDSIKTGIADAAGDDVGPEHVTLTLSEGSVHVDAVIRVPQILGEPSSEVVDNLAASISTGSLATVIASAVSDVPGIAAAATGSIGVSAVTAPLATGVPTTTQESNVTPSAFEDSQSVASAGSGSSSSCTWFYLLCGGVLACCCICVSTGCYIKRRRRTRGSSLETAGFRDNEMGPEDFQPNELRPTIIV